MKIQKLILQWLRENKDQLYSTFDWLIRSRSRRQFVFAINDLYRCICEHEADRFDVVLSNGETFKNAGKLVFSLTEFKEAIERRHKSFVRSRLTPIYRLVSKYLKTTHQMRMPEDHPIDAHLKLYESVIGVYWRLNPKQYATEDKCKYKYFVSTSDIVTYIDWIFNGKIMKTPIPKKMSDNRCRRFFNTYETDHGRAMIFSSKKRQRHETITEEISAKRVSIGTSGEWSMSDFDFMSPKRN
jgi:hypothetical protein